MTIIHIEQQYMRTSLPVIRSGDTVRVYQRIKEGDKERVNVFEGLVIARKHGTGVRAMITVRIVVDGIGVERIFPIHSPAVEKIEVLKSSKVRRAKLYYIREKAAREIRRKMKSIWREAAPATIKQEEAAEVMAE